MNPLEKYFNEKKIREAAEKAAIASVSRIIDKSIVDFRLSNNYDPEINRVVDFRDLYLKNKDKLMQIKSICDNSDSELATQIKDILGTIV